MFESKTGLIDRIEDSVDEAGNVIMHVDTIRGSCKIVIPKDEWREAIEYGKYVIGDEIDKQDAMHVISKWLFSKYIMKRI